MLQVRPEWWLNAGSGQAPDDQRELNADRRAPFRAWTGHQLRRPDLGDRGAAAPRRPAQISAARLTGPQQPFTAPAAGDPGHSWRVLVRALPGGRHTVIAFSLDNWTAP
jgi:hypothetical protein